MRAVRISELMQTSGVKFGTSGARGLVSAMTDRVCYAYAAAFIEHMEQKGAFSKSSGVALAGDLRASTERILTSVARAVSDRGHEIVHAGRVPTPALALFGMVRQMPSIMVTGSHIPEDRNGLKFNTPAGEILKADEAAIAAREPALPDCFAADGGFAPGQRPRLPPVAPEAARHYVDRYLQCFATDALKGVCVGLYGHSAVGRDLLDEVLQGLGAAVTRLGYSDEFVAVDTEAVRPEDARSAQEWADEHAFDAIVTTDGDGDRPLVADERGRWLRGDVAGILCARYLQADAVVAPISCNSALELSGWFERVTRTRIGSPYVIEGMQRAVAAGGKRVVGYEANGGFLTASSLPLPRGALAPLPTRDACVVLIAMLAAARARGVPVSSLPAELPARFTASSRLADFPTALSGAKLGSLERGGARALSEFFGEAWGAVTGVDTTDGVRATFHNGEIVHLRASGNAPELRCYAEAATELRALELTRLALGLCERWR
jgi:phosphomannomutase